jgi:3-hydroxybutyryl-CoA dehydrogenase
MVTDDLKRIKKITVVGSGVMGIQISQLLALKGFDVFLKSRKQDSIESGLNRINQSLQRSIEEKRITAEQANSTFSRIKGTTSVSEAGRNCDILIESIVEKAEEKKRLLAEFENICPKETIFCSNTSSLSITDISNPLKFPEKFIGLHFLNPVMSIKLVEVIKGKSTSQKTTDLIDEFALYLGKYPLVLNDSPGFLVNRMLIPMINEAVFMLQENIASRDQIDLSMKLGAKHPIGPLALADLIGLDVCLSIMQSLYQQFNDPKYCPSTLLVQMVKKNLLGRKTKKGFYDYN